MKDVERRVSHATAWVSFAVATVAVLDGLTMFLLLRWIAPAELGVAAKARWLFPALQVLADVGFSAALVQREQDDEEMLSAAFWILLAVAGLFNVALWLGGLGMASWYRQPVLLGLMGGYGVKMLVQVPALVPMALLKRELRFRELSLIRVLCNFGDFAGKVGFALAGFHIFCWVAGPIVYAVIMAVSVFVLRRWRPRGRPPLARAALLLWFGLKNSAAQVLFEFYGNIDYLLGSFFFSDADLGLYHFSRNILTYPIKLVSGITVDIALPAVSRLRFDQARLTEQFLRFVRQNLVLGLPVIVFVWFGIPDLSGAVFPQYAGATTLARLFCVVGFVRCLNLVMPPLLVGLGHPGVYLLYSLTATVALPALSAVAAYTLGPRLGIMSLAIAWVVGYPILFVGLSWCGLRFAAIPATTYLRVVVTTVVTAALCFAPVALLAQVLGGPPSVSRLLLLATAVAGGSGGLFFIRIAPASPAGGAKGQ